MNLLKKLILREINHDEAMDSLIEQLEIKHSYNDMEERYWFNDGE